MVHIRETRKTEACIGACETCCYGQGAWDYLTAGKRMGSFSGKECLGGRTGAGRVCLVKLCYGRWAVADVGSRHMLGGLEIPMKRESAEREVVW